MRRMESPQPPRAKGATKRTKKRPFTDLQRQFLELQRLRERVRIAQCGRMAPSLEDAYELQVRHGFER
jgi:hypothetical protein